MTAATKAKSAKKIKATLTEADLAVNGGRKTIKAFGSKPEPKIGVEEAMALVSLWGYSDGTLAKVRALLDKESVGSPHLARYYCPKPSRVAELEAYSRDLFGVKYALGVNSGTSALTSAYVACGIGPGDEVIIPGYTFFATAAAVIAAKALPVIAEIDDSLTLDPKDVEKKITPRTKAIVPVHMVGCACDMAGIMKIARKHNLLVVEDNAQSCGGKFKGKFLGSIGDMGCFSLSTFKITGAGEAGLVLTNDEYLYIRAQNQHDTAACWRPQRYARERQPGELFAGQNYRMSELEGAVNLLQMQKTKAQAERFNKNMQRVHRQIGTFKNTILRRSNDLAGDVGYRLVMFGKDAESATKLAKALSAEGVPTYGRGDSNARDWHIYPYWEHIMEQKSATDKGCPFTCPLRNAPLPKYTADMCPNTLDYINRAVFVSVDQWWKAADCDHVAAAINKVCSVLG
ncbi:MAG: hypothetical protein A3K19_12600 [Lentisphaerae bacterium RIFOXYB12_FULL_65_16]|nr:MAG: hypothetical protein A3K18_12075 [Lentisphaerae bacterium RIFOXYA12_64_32]OGV88123.1 MAG: hypothetical protein A3K19_12600 [Lentisphaerae bacterium RIFOXYB12_FULL_65_16]